MLKSRFDAFGIGNRYSTVLLDWTVMSLIARAYYNLEQQHSCPCPCLHLYVCLVRINLMLQTQFIVSAWLPSSESPSRSPLHLSLSSLDWVNLLPPFLSQRKPNPFSTFTTRRPSLRSTKTLDPLKTEEQTKIHPNWRSTFKDPFNVCPEGVSYRRPAMLQRVRRLIGLDPKSPSSSRVSSAKSPLSSTRGAVLFRPPEMFETVHEIAIYIHRFHNLDLFQQG